MNWNTKGIENPGLRWIFRIVFTFIGGFSSELAMATLTPWGGGPFPFLWGAAWALAIAIVVSRPEYPGEKVLAQGDLLVELELIEAEYLEDCTDSFQKEFEAEAVTRKKRNGWLKIYRRDGTWVEYNNSYVKQISWDWEDDEIHTGIQGIRSGSGGLKIEGGDQNND